MIEELANLERTLTASKFTLTEEVYQKHMDTVKKMIGIYDEWQEMWRMLSVEDPNSCVALAEDIEHKHKIIHYDLDMDDLYERVRD